MKYSKFIKTVSDSFDKIVASSDLMLQVDVGRDELFDTFLEMVSNRQQHTCNSCRAFFRNYGNVVAINNAGDRVTVWDIAAKSNDSETGEDCDDYARVAAVLRAKVLAAPIRNPFLPHAPKLGNASNLATLDDGSVIRYHHVHAEVPRARLFRKSDVDRLRGEMMATVQLFGRGLQTITIDAVESVLSLIAENNLYRGKEFEKALKEFHKHQVAYAKLTNDAKKSAYVWKHFKEGGRIRNTSVGILLVDLSKGVPLDTAVAAFERMVAPANYRRTTAVVTESMVKNARKTIEALGYESALDRRHATIDDIPVTEALYVDRAQAGKKQVFDALASAAVKPSKSFDKVQTVSISEFAKEVLPQTTSLEMYLEDTQNFASLIAPVDPDAKNLLAWSNPISWMYQTNNTDVIKEKVKDAGGLIDAALRVSLEWFNYDDLDLRLVEPNGEIISFRNRISRAGGALDVDQNAGSGHTREPVENIAYGKNRKPHSGTYTVRVHNFSKRENKDFGFNIQIEANGEIINISHPKAVFDDAVIQVAKFDYDPAHGVTNVRSDFAQNTASREVNGLSTNTFHKVRMVVPSPNYWGRNEIGNEHLFFILEGARIDTSLRPFSNEFLNKELREHRKVFEALSNKLMVEPSDVQVTGVGLSLTQNHTIVVRVNNSRVVKVQF